MSADSLTRSNSADISDINNLLPSVQLKGGFNNRVPMALRGISTISDQMRIEVLKGPQSTPIWPLRSIS